MFYVAPTVDNRYAVLGTNASGHSTCVSTHVSVDEAEQQAESLNIMSGADEEIEDVPEEMSILLDQLR